jgi:peptide/nickel transport system substrate-binding protein
VLGLVGEPTTLVPLFGNTSADAEVTGLLFRELVARTPQGLVPDLAARVPRLGDGAHLEGERLVVDWELKPNVHWNDGVAVTSADVIAGWKVALDDVEVVQGREQAQAIERIDVVDAHRFRVVWRKPEPGFAAPRVHRVLPAHLVFDATGAVRKPLRSLRQRPVGNSGLQLVARIDGAHLLLRRLRPATGREVDEVLVRFFPTTDGLTSALLANEVDATMQHVGLSPTEADRLWQAHPQRFVVEKAPGASWVHLDFNLDDPVLKDLRVREAIALALDRKALVQAVAGEAYDVDEGFLPRHHPAWTKTPLRAADTARSEKLLDEAGFRRPAAGAVRADLSGAPLRLQLAAASGQRDTERLLAMVQSSLRAVGVDVVLDLKPFKVFFAEGAKKRALPHMALYAWTIDIDGVGGSLWRADRIPSVSNNFTGQNLPGWRNQSLTAELSAADASLDENVRLKAAQRAQEAMIRELPALSFYFRPAVVLHRLGVSGVRPTGTLTPMAFFLDDWRVEPAPSEVLR